VASRAEVARGRAEARPSTTGGDLAGGATAALLSIPVSMGLGALAVHPLGPQYTGYGILAGLASAIVTPIVAVLAGSRTPIVFGPRSVIASLVSSVVLQGLVTSGVAASRTPHEVLTLLFCIIVLAGLFQALFGALRLGGFVRYLPSPVMAGFQTGAAILIVLSQVDTLLGFKDRVPVSQVLQHLPDAQPLTLAIGILTAWAMWKAPHITRRIPPAIVGLCVGAGLYYAIVALGGRAWIGSTIGTVSPMPLALYVPGIVRLFTSGAWWDLAPLVTGALSLAVITALDTLLCAKAIEASTGIRASGNDEVFRLGLGNLVAGGLGGISSGISLSSTYTNYRTGGRSALSLLVSGVTILIIALFLTPVLGYIPRVVIAGVLIVVAAQLVDQWSLQLAHRTATSRFRDWKRVTLDVGIVVLVAVVAIAVDLFLAVAIGAGVAVLFFILRMSRNVVRRAYYGDAVHSHKTRDRRLMDVLQEHGRQILVLELEGPIFFGTAEALANRVEAATVAGASFVVLDLKRVNEIDATGTRILLQIHRTLAQEGRHLLLSNLPGGGPVAGFLEAMGVIAAVTPSRVFLDTDRALEWAEDQIIRKAHGEITADDEAPLDRLDLLATLTGDECEALRRLLVRRTYHKGDVVFREGDEGREMFIIARGAASVSMRLAGEDRAKRLATFTAGTVFGELALLDAGPRSASVEADEELTCYLLTEAGFATLAREHHAVAIKLLANLGRELSQRLRRANQTIYQLET
jgi:MFS superfamily sulfate permease-like transporter